MAPQSLEAMTLPVEQLETSLRCVRCSRPVLVEQMASNLSRQGQLTPVVAVQQTEKREVIDGFKRHAAAKLLGLATLKVSVVALDEVARWAAMLALNHGAGRMTELEEALVIRKIVTQGLTQVQVAQLVQRHKTWVSRRVGLPKPLEARSAQPQRSRRYPPGTTRSSGDRWGRSDVSPSARRKLLWGERPERAGA